eukprot:scaffold1233_cov395-Prasinococcus_capsulatus_cf.AAC.23
MWDDDNAGQRREREEPRSARSRAASSGSSRVAMRDAVREAAARTALIAAPRRRQQQLLLLLLLKLPLLWPHNGRRTVRSERGARARALVGDAAVRGCEAVGRREGPVAATRRRATRLRSHLRVSPVTFPAEHPTSELPPGARGLGLGCTGVRVTPQPRISPNYNKRSFY